MNALWPVAWGYLLRSIAFIPGANFRLAVQKFGNVEDVRRLIYPAF
jgi:hypothetical protein